MSQTLTGVHYLGCTYDIYGYYARANSVNTSQRLFVLPDTDTDIAVSGDEYSYPKEAISTPVLLYETDEKTSSHESTEELYTEMSVSANLSGSYGLFSAEVSAKYSESYTGSSYFYHVDKSGYVNSYKLTLDLDYMLDHLDEDFEADLNDTAKDSQGNVKVDTNGNVEYVMSAGALVAKYGTHFLYEAIFGGRWSYSQSVSKFSYSSSQEAEVQVDANYSTYSGSISASNQTDKSQSSHQSNGEFWCIGGTPDTLVDGFDDWAASVPGNFVLVDFTDNSLKRISELAADSYRKETIDTVITKLLSTETLSMTELTTSSETQEWTTAQKDKQIDVDSEVKNGYAVVGFGGRINKDKKFTRIAVCYLNLSTAQREWNVFGDKTIFNKDEYETLGEVPEGCVMTGIGLKGHGNHLGAMVLHYQELSPARSTNAYLDPTLQSIYFKRQQQDTSNKPERDYEVELNPSDNNNKVITGLGVGYRGKHEAVQFLRLDRTTIVGNTVILEDTSEEDTSEEDTEDSNYTFDS